MSRPEPRSNGQSDEAGAIRFVSLEEWRAGREALLAEGAALGLRLASHESPAAAADDLDRFAAIALEFPKFTDGRAYTSARLLRERYGYKGEIRAVGEVLRDQIWFMRRCGFDAFELADEADAEALARAESEISVVYQPAADGRPPAYLLRCHRAAPRGARTAAAPARRGAGRGRPESDSPASALAPAAVAAHWAY